MFTRSYPKPDHSFFLFGPRSTGKTTWLRSQFPDAVWFNLLRDAELIPLLQNPALLRQRVLAQKGGWVVLDEVQKAPSLLNEVHDIISLHEHRYRFVLSGSSARKLKQQGVNLLAGRVLTKFFFPLLAEELGQDFSLEEALRLGTLPAIHNRRDLGEELLLSYVGTYIKEEIRQEALVKEIPAFTRFLKVAAITNGTIPNFSGIARDTGIARKTVEGYFEILVDTLIGTWLPAWQPKARLRERARSKFYLFDCGVTRALSGLIDAPLHPEERGILLETLILNELRARISMRRIKGTLSYWQSSSGSEVDFVVTRGRQSYGVEVKASPQWRSAYGKTLKQLVHEQVLQRVFGVYTGEQELQDGPIRVLPLRNFLEQADELFV